jgi:hypothetical protein
VWVESDKGAGERDDTANNLYLQAVSPELRPESTGGCRV